MRSNDGVRHRIIETHAHFKETKQPDPFLVQYTRRIMAASGEPVVFVGNPQAHLGEQPSEAIVEAFQQSHQHIEKMLPQCLTVLPGQMVKTILSKVILIVLEDLVEDRAPNALERVGGMLGAVHAEAGCKKPGKLDGIAAGTVAAQWRNRR